MSSQLDPVTMRNNNFAIQEQKKIIEATTPVPNKKKLLST